jgi:predicted secreted hydrolase
MKAFSNYLSRSAVFLGMVGLMFLGPLQADPESASVTPSSPPSTPATTWRQAIDPWAWSFPRDHGAHPDFKTEWWYFTGNLQDSAQRKFGYQLTIFRQGVQFVPTQTDSKWAVRDAYFGHLTISDLSPQKFHVAERLSRGALGDATAATDHMEVNLGPWSIKQDDNEQIHLTAREDEIAIDLTLRPAKPLVLEGVNGLSQKAEGAGNASYYYSYPRLETSGNLQLGEMTYTVSGTSWFDHEFSSSLLGENQKGWDWFCIQLDNHEEIMLYVMRDKDGKMDPVSEGTWIREKGNALRIEPLSFFVEKTGTWKSPKSGATYPSGWQISIPGHQIDLTVSPLMLDQELRLTKMGKLNYWEGACTVEGKVGAQLVTGVGYTELTGYGDQLETGTVP